MPFLVADGAAKAIDWYGEVFGAETASRFDGPDGIVYHAQLRLPNGCVMELGDPSEALGLAAGGAGHGVVLTVWCPDMDAVHGRAVAAGARELSAPEDGFTGDRMSRIVDPYGHRWVVATHVEDVSDEEIARRIAAMGAGGDVA
ncbi:VOC family protein [Mangrovactinospora gilvigrisea]|uniref:VOC family protein n=1 Tax=Mangrovactinospora gilvigrisea TaxID=1428644 RepID=UPI000AC4E205|nr:VOC family protein [Mangrovactinospora gilvigrisea]